MTVTINGTTGIAGVDGSAGTPSYQGNDSNTGIFFPAADTIAFAEGGTEIARFDNAGNLGIGDSPSEKLSLRNSAGRVSIFMASGATNQGYISYFNSTQQLSFGCGVPTGTGTNGGQQVNIDVNGNLLVGVTSPVTVSGVPGANSFSSPSVSWATVVQNSNASLPWGLAVRYSGASPNNTTQNFLWCTDSGDTNRFNVRSNGGVVNYQANDGNLSDRREKTNFAPAKSYLDVICSIPVQTFNYIDQNHEEDDGLTLGVVAQDVQAVAPELVSESNWGTEENPKMRLSIYQTDLQYALMKCIQEQQAIITDLKTRIEALEKTNV